MKLSLVTEYGIRGMVHLATAERDRRVSLEEICESGSIPRNYLSKIFQSLVKAGLIVSFRGRGGGFSLARAPERISLMDLVQSLEGESSLTRCVVRAQNCDEGAPCLVHQFWSTAESKMRNELAKCSLKDIVGYYRSCTRIEMPPKIAEQETSEDL